MDTDHLNGDQCTLSTFTANSVTIIVHSVKTFIQGKNIVLKT